jgi:hypothetical protein
VSVRDSDGRTRSPGGQPVLVASIGDEPLAPLVLARQIGARNVVCVGQPVLEWRVEPLLQMLRREGRAAEWIAVDVDDVPSGVAEIRSRLPFAIDGDVVFDLTNARSVLGFALYELALAHERDTGQRCRILRVDWSDRLVRSVSPDAVDTSPLRAQLTLSEYFAAHGKYLLGIERGPGSRTPFGEAARRIAASIPQARALLTATHRGHPDRPLRLNAREASSRLVDALVDDGVLDREGRSVISTSLRAFQFLHGRWLEEYLFEIADASGQFDDCASGVRFGWALDESSPESEVANEIDFAGTAGGRATIASCKTGGHDVNGPLYELLTIAERAAGRSVVTVFATVDTLDRPARRRAAALGVRILDAPRLADPAVVLTSLLNGTPPATTRSSPTIGSTTRASGGRP